MKFSVSFSLILITTFPSLANGQMYEMFGNGSAEGQCRSSTGEPYDQAMKFGVPSVEECDQVCRRTNNYSEGLRGFSYGPAGGVCSCHYDGQTGPGQGLQYNWCRDGTEFLSCQNFFGSGPVATIEEAPGFQCYQYIDFPVPSIPVPDTMSFVGKGKCGADLNGAGIPYYDSTTNVIGSSFILESCHQHCQEYPEGLRGLSYDASRCYCWYDDGYAPGGPLSSEPSCPSDLQCNHDLSAVGEVTFASNNDGNYGYASCWKYPASSVTVTQPPTVDPYANEIYDWLGDGLDDFCSSSTALHGVAWVFGVPSEEECDRMCRRSNNYSEGLRGFVYGSGDCGCLYENGIEPGNDLANPNCPEGYEFSLCYAASYRSSAGVYNPNAGHLCFQYRASVGFPLPSIPVPTGIDFVGHGYCKASTGGEYHDVTLSAQGFASLDKCDQHCREYPQGLRGFTYGAGVSGYQCLCWYDDGYAPGGPLASQPCPVDGSRTQCINNLSGTGDIQGTTSHSDARCWEYTTFPVVEATGDPHFRTWKNEHFEFHGQCDIVMTKVENFANQQGIDLEIQLRTKIVRYWSYIKTAAIRIGNDILEVEGSSADKEDGEEKRHYHINYEYRGPLDTLGGFPVTISPSNNRYTIDLGSAFPGQKIEIKTFKEFVGVKIIRATEESFGNAVGITGDFKTGKTLARDGTTVLHDFNELGLEWQVLPSDGKLFHEVAKPQFPELCYLPEDPRGERARRLGESDISEKAAEAACNGLKDEFDRKGCVYDVLATQDMDMAGAY